MAITFSRVNKSTPQFTQYGMAWTINTQNVTVTSSSFSVPAPTMTATAYGYNAVSGSSFANVSWSIWATVSNNNFNTTQWNFQPNQQYANWSFSFSGGEDAWTSKALSGFASASLYGTTSNFFNANNKTTKTVTVTALGSWSMSNGASQSVQNLNQACSGSFTITLDKTPTFSQAFSYTNDFSGVPYANKTTANVTLSGLTAYYGGDFTGVGSATLTIGSQTTTINNPTNNDVLSIALNSVGTFTPTVSVTDSRGQTTTHTLNAITVQGYNAPSVAFNTERTTSTGTPDDEGVYAVINPTFTFTDAIATLSAPTVAVTDDGGLSQTVSTTWYSTRASDGTLSGSVTWANLSSGDTVYGLVSITGDFNTQKSYQIAVTPVDSEDTGTTITQTLGGAYYTVDFYAGGHGIAFGQPATTTGFFCNMDAHFVDANSVMRALFDFVYPVGSYYETSDTTFNPNTTWGGTWVLEAEGQVHISAGTNYTVAGALTNTTDGGSPYIQAHTHGFTRPTISSGGNWAFDVSALGARTGSTTLAGAVTNTSASASGSTRYRVSNNTYTASASLTDRITHSGHGHGSTGGSVDAVSGLPTGQSTGNAGNMPPYIIVNRWHRTA